MSIEKIWAREILDSRGNPTVEVDLYTAKGNGPGVDIPQPLLPQRWAWTGLRGLPWNPGTMGCQMRFPGLECGI